MSASPVHTSKTYQARERGLSLVEILVSMAIGLVVVGAVFANFINSSAGAKQSAALAQVTDDATLALGILRNHVTMADYSQPTGTDDKSGLLRRRLDKQLNLRGCDGGFDASTDGKADPTLVLCNADPKPTDSDALLVRYEADSDALPTVTTGTGTTAKTTPMDCKGSGIPQATGGTHFVADNRFFVNTSSTPSSLSCIGNGGAKTDADDFEPSQPLVENITEMRIRYGVASLDATTKRPLNIVRYATAAQVGGAGSTSGASGTSDTSGSAGGASGTTGAAGAAAAGVAGSADATGTTGTSGTSGKATLIESWSQVVSVRICVVVRSAEHVLDKPRPYYNCDGTLVRLDTANPATDRRIYRAFTSTVVLNNRVNTPASASETPPTTTPPTQTP